MEKLSAWLFLLIALLWLLPLVGVSLGTWGSWLAVVALAGVGVVELRAK